jgi:hypothetical protein
MMANAPRYGETAEAGRTPMGDHPDALQRQVDALNLEVHRPLDLHATRRIRHAHGYFTAMWRYDETFGRSSQIPTRHRTQRAGSRK